MLARRNASWKAPARLRIKGRNLVAKCPACAERFRAGMRPRVKMCSGRRAKFTDHFHRAVASRRALKGMKAAAYQPIAIRTASLVMSSFFFHHVIASRSDWLPRYSCVTVKLSMLLTRPRIWGIPTTTASNRSPSNNRTESGSP